MAVKIAWEMKGNRHLLLTGIVNLISNLGIFLEGTALLDSPSVPRLAVSLGRDDRHHF